MNIGKRLQELRQAKGLSQEDIELRTGLPRTFISRIENAHAAPMLQTLEKLAGGLEVPLWLLFYENDWSPANLAISQKARVEDLIADSPVEDAAYLIKLQRFTRRMDESNHNLLLGLMRKMARRGG